MASWKILNQRFYSVCIRYKSYESLKSFGILFYDRGATEQGLGHGFTYLSRPFLEISFLNGNPREYGKKRFLNMVYKPATGGARDDIDIKV